MRCASRLAGAGLAVLVCAMTAAAVDTESAKTVRVGDETWFRSEWRASTFAMSSQSQATLAAGQDGLTVAWASRRQQEGRYGVYAQRFDPFGVAVGEETGVNLWTASHQWGPAAVATADGVWIAWQSHDQDGDAGAIVARRLADGGGRDGSEILVNGAGRGHQSDPTIAAAASGRVLIAWTSRAAASEPPRVRARLFDATGAPAGDEFGVCAEDGWRQRTPAPAFAPDGSFVIVYAVTEADPVFTGVRLQRFDAEGRRVGFPVDVTGAMKRSQIEPDVAALPGGGFVVAWLDAESDGEDYGVLARCFDRAGAPLGAAFVVNETVRGSQNAAGVAVRPDGRFAIAWNGSDREGAAVLARMFGPDGRALGGAFALTAPRAGDQAMRAAAAVPRIAFDAGGALLCAWSGDGGFGDGSSANVTMLSPAPLVLGGVLGGRTQGVTEDMRPASEVPDALAAGAPEPHVPPAYEAAKAGDDEREVRLGAGGDVGFLAVTNTGWTPPDPHMGVGPNHVVVMTNGNISFYTKAGDRTFTQDIVGANGFWGQEGASGFVFDPEVLYDELSGRFFVMAADRNSGNGRSYALVGVSDDPDPNGTWYKYRFDTTPLAGSLFDSPNIGVDADVVYITGDGFGGPQPYPIFTFDKASLLAGDPPAVTRSFGLGTSTQSAGIPPVSFDDPPALYMIEHREGGANTTVRLIALQDPLGAPTFTEFILPVPVYGPPENPPQSGTSSRPNTFDQRFWSVAYRGGSLWASHHINSSRVLARWYEIDMNGWPDSGDDPVLVQSGEIDPGAGVRTFFVAITADRFGNAAVTYARSSFDEFISMETAYRYASDPLGVFRPGVQRQVNTGPYTQGRWGDYGAVNVDPVDGKTMWAHHEYAIGNSWRTWVQGWTPEFSVADVNCDGVVNFEDLLRLLGAWGPCPGCPEDLNDDDVVDFEDLLTLLAEWS